MNFLDTDSAMVQRGQMGIEIIQIPAKIIVDVYTDGCVKKAAGIREGVRLRMNGDNLSAQSQLLKASEIFSGRHP